MNDVLYDTVMSDDDVFVSATRLLQSDHVDKIIKYRQKEM